MTINLPEFFKQRPYPGRFLILGVKNNHHIAVYGVTARSQASRVKRYVLSPDHTRVHVEPTDRTIMAQGDLTLLDYTAVYFFPNGLIMGNGRQTDLITNLRAISAEEQLNHDLKNTSFEPDKYSTPRITGCWLQTNGAWSGALHSTRNDGRENPEHACYSITDSSNALQLISTYNGPNIRPTPSFIGGPLAVNVQGGTAQEIAGHVYAALAPTPGNEDLRVAVVTVVFGDSIAGPDVCCINSVDQQL